MSEETDFYKTVSQKIKMMKKHSIPLLEYVAQTVHALRWFLPQLRKIFFLVVSLFFVLVLVLLPLPTSLQSYWPLWPLLWLLVGVLFLPHAFVVVIAWILGLMLDNVCGYYLGTHVFVFILNLYLFRFFLLQESTTLNKRIYETAFIFFLFIFYQLTLFLMQRITSFPAQFQTKSMVMSAAMSTLLWFYCVDIIQSFSDKAFVESHT